MGEYLIVFHDIAIFCK